MIYKRLLFSLLLTSVAASSFRVFAMDVVLDLKGDSVRAVRSSRTVLDSDGYQNLNENTSDYDDVASPRIPSYLNLELDEVTENLTQRESLSTPNQYELMPCSRDSNTLSTGQDPTCPPDGASKNLKVEEEIYDTIKDYEALKFSREERPLPDVPNTEMNAYQPLVAPKIEKGCLTPLRKKVFVGAGVAGGVIIGTALAAYLATRGGGAAATADFTTAFDGMGLETHGGGAAFEGLTTSLSYSTGVTTRASSSTELSSTTVNPRSKWVRSLGLIDSDGVLKPAQSVREKFVGCWMEQEGISRAAFNVRDFMLSVTTEDNPRFIVKGQHTTTEVVNRMFMVLVNGSKQDRPASVQRLIAERKRTADLSRRAHYDPEPLSDFLLKQLNFPEKFRGLTLDEKNSLLQSSHVYEGSNRISEQESTRIFNNLAPRAQEEILDKHYFGANQPAVDRYMSSASCVFSRQKRDVGSSVAAWQQPEAFSIMMRGEETTAGNQGRIHRALFGNTFHSNDKNERGFSLPYSNRAQVRK